MRVLLVSFYAQARLFSSTAQNTRFLASGLLEQGHDVRVVCTGHSDETIVQDGYPLMEIPILSSGWKRRWLDTYLPDARIRKVAQKYFANWRPDVIYVGASQRLIDFAVVGIEWGIPVVQMVHDYTVLCLRQWLVDSWGENCTGPVSLRKCMKCVRHSLGPPDRLKDMALSIPLLGPSVRRVLGEYSRFNIHVKTVVGEAFSFLQTYRDQVSLFIAQAPQVVDVLRSGGIVSSRCRFVPQYIGEEKLRPYPRPTGVPGVDRPIRFVYIGRWSRIKGTHLLLDAFIRAKTVIPVELWIISQSPKVGEALALFNQESHPDKTIRVFNNLTGGAVSRQLALADVLVVPSTWLEVASRVVLEAHAQGVPVIASSTVGNRYTIEDGMNGAVFPSGDMSALQNIIEQIASNVKTVSLWARKRYNPIRKDLWLSRISKVLSEAIGLEVDIATQGSKT